MSLEEPESKKLKTADDAKLDGEANAGGEEEGAAGAMRNDDGDAYFELSKARRVTVRQFKGNVLVDIREVR